MRTDKFEEDENYSPNESKTNIPITNSNEKLSGKYGQPLVVEEDPAASESGRKART